MSETTAWGCTYCDQMWQPIDTAPKDGTLILGWGEWAGEINGISSFPCMNIITWTEGSTDYPGYRWRVVGTDAYAAWQRPSHWMPLPEPPGAS